MTKRKKARKKAPQKKTEPEKGEAIDFGEVDLSEFKPLDLSSLKPLDLSSLEHLDLSELTAFKESDLDELLIGSEELDRLINQGLGPEEKVGTEGERRGSVEDVAQWMLAELERSKSKTLYQSRAALNILKQFGGGFIYRNKNNNYAIDLEVLKHFRTLTDKTIVWIRKQRFWRLRQPGDPPGRSVE